MTSVEEKLEELRRKEGYSNDKMGAVLGMTGSGYHSMIKNGTTKVSALYLVCEKFNVSMSFFFDDEEYSSDVSNELQEDSRYKALFEQAKETIKRQDQLVEELRSTVNFLKKTLDFFMRRQSDEPDVGKPDSGNVQGLMLNNHYQRCTRESSRAFAVTA